MLKDEDLKHIEKWSESSENLQAALLSEEASVYREMSEGILNLISDFQNIGKITPTGKEDLKGIEDLYTLIQLQFEGGEDLMDD